MSMKTTMTTRVRRRRPRVPPRKGHQPLPQFGAGSPVGDELRLRSLNSLLRLMGEKQIGGRLTPRQMKAAMRATDPRRHDFVKNDRRVAQWFQQVDVKYTMATIRRRRPFMGRGMYMVRRPRRQRGGRMHYMRRRFQKGKGLSKQTQKMNDLFGVPLYAMMALTADIAHSRKK